MMEPSVAALILAKGESRRLPGKNVKDFAGKPMFLWNVEKCLSLFDKVYVSSDDERILFLAWQAGAIKIKRDTSLGGDVPNIPVYQHALRNMKDVSAIVAVQACSPTIDKNLIATTKRLLEMGVPEVMTCHPIERAQRYHDQNFKLYGSIWGLQADILRNYGNPYEPDPDALLVDTSIDIHNIYDYNDAIDEFYGKN